MFKLSTAALVATSSLAILAAASPAKRNPCSTGTLQCCDSTSSTSDPSTSKLLGLLGIVVQGPYNVVCAQVEANLVSGVDVPIGLGCSPITVIGVSGNSCSTNTVCCESTDDGQSSLLICLFGIADYVILDSQRAA
jgi:hypothetical protein